MSTAFHAAKHPPPFLHMKPFLTLRMVHSFWPLAQPVEVGQMLCGAIQMIPTKHCPIDGILDMEIGQSQSIPRESPNDQNNFHLYTYTYPLILCHVCIYND